MRNAGCFDWTDSAVARLKELWGEGFSASECGQRMGVSRNSIIGKVHRLGLSGKYRRPREGRRRMTKPKTSMPQMRTNNRPLPPPQPYQAPPPTEEPRRCSFDLLDLKLGQCRYPHGERPFRFCGAPVVDSYPYCLEHAELCYNKPVAARAAA